MNPNILSSTTPKKRRYYKEAYKWVAGGCAWTPLHVPDWPQPFTKRTQPLSKPPWASHGLFFHATISPRVTNLIINHPEPSPHLRARGHTTQMQRPSRLPHTHSDTRGGKRRERGERRKRGRVGGGRGGKVAPHSRRYKILLVARDKNRALFGIFFNAPLSTNGTATTSSYAHPPVPCPCPVPPNSNFYVHLRGGGGGGGVTSRCIYSRISEKTVIAQTIRSQWRAPCYFLSRNKNGNVCAPLQLDRKAKK